MAVGIKKEAVAPSPVKLCGTSKQPASVVKQENHIHGGKVKSEGKVPKKRGGKKKDENKKKILSYLSQMKDRNGIPKKEVAEAIGYMSPGSHPFFYAYRELVEEGMIVRGDLTEKGIRSVPSESFSFSKPRTNKEKQDCLFKALRKKVKEGTEDKVKKVFEILSDGKAHELKEFTKATGYANLKSKGLGYNLSYMEKEMKIVEKTAPNTWRFVDKCFPNGRPL